MKKTDTLKIEDDHIGLYPRKGNASNDSEIPLVYILSVPEGSGILNISNDHPLSAPIKKQLNDGHPWW